VGARALPLARWQGVTKRSARSAIAIVELALSARPRNGEALRLRYIVIVKVLIELEGDDAVNRHWLAHAVIVHGLASRGWEQADSRTYRGRRSGHPSRLAVRRSGL